MGKLVFEYNNTDITIAMDEIGSLATHPDDQQINMLAAYALFTSSEGTPYPADLRSEHMMGITTLVQDTARLMDDEQQSHLKFGLRQRGMEVSDDAEIVLYQMSDKLYAPFIVSPWKTSIEAMQESRTFSEGKFLTSHFLGSGVHMPGRNDVTRTVQLAEGLLVKEKDGLRFMQPAGVTNHHEFRANVLRALMSEMPRVDRSYGLSDSHYKATDAHMNQHGKIYVSLNYEAMISKLNVIQGAPVIWDQALRAAR